MAIASLIVRISADLNSFTKNLDKMTRDVDKAAKRVSAMGKELTIGITLPATLAGAALVRLAMNGEVTNKRLEAVFGGMSTQMNAFLDDLRKQVPVSRVELEKTAVAADDVAQGLGAGQQQAMLMTQGLMMMANVISAKRGLGFDEVMNSLQRGLAGSSRGLKVLGIGITDAEVKQRAYEMGILRSGNALTALGKALATYSILMEQSKRMSTDLTDVNNSTARSWEGLKADLADLGNKVGSLLLPALSEIIGVLKSFVNLVSNAPPWLIKTTVAIIALAAVVGPTLMLLAKFAQALVAVRSAILLGGGIEGALAALTNPIGLVIAGVVVLVGVLWGLYAIWKKLFGKKDDATPATSGWDAMAANAKKMQESLKNGAGGPTDINTQDPLARYNQHASDLHEAFTRALKVGDMTSPFLDDIKKQMASAGAIISTTIMSGGSPFDKWVLAAEKIADQWREIVETMKVADALHGPNPQGDIARASRAITSDQQIGYNLASRAISDETALREREIAVQLTNTFDAMRIATLELKETFRATSTEFHKTVASVGAQWSNVGDSLTAGLEQGATGFIASLGPMALAATAVGDVLKGLQPFLDALSGPLEELGKMIGIMLLPLMRPLFEALKVLGIVASFLGEILARVTGGIATAVGKLLVGIGNLLNKLPGSIGNPLKAAGNAILQYAAAQYETADQLKRARAELEGLSYDDAINGVNALGNAATRAANALENVPIGWKIALETFRAVTPISGTTHNPTGGGTSDGSGSGGSGGARVSGGTRESVVPPTVVNIQLDKRTIAHAVIGWAQGESTKNFGTPTRWSEVLV